MSIYAFPHAAGVKLRGVNIFPGPSAWAVGEGDVWYQQWYKWATGASPDVWTGWLQPCIDQAAVLGCNAIRLILSGAVWVGTGFPHLTTPQIEDSLDRFISYCATKGIWVYLCLYGTTQLNTDHADNNVSLADAQSYMAKVVAFTSTYSNMLGYDVVNEIAPPTSGFAWDNRAELVSAVTAARVNPITVAVSLVPLDHPIDLTIANAIAGAGALPDFHLYPLGGDYWTLSDVEPAFFNAGDGPEGTTDYPVFMGEMGANVNDSDSTQQTDVYTVMAQLASQARLQGAMNWNILQGQTPDPVTGGVGDYSLYTPDSTPSWGGARTNMLTPFQTIPKTPQPYDAAQDAFAVTHDAPTMSSRTRSTLSLAWSSATGGSGTITYTPQYAPLDANGFPSAAWSNGTPTTGTSGVITGLTSNVPYGFRILTSGAAA